MNQPDTSAGWKLSREDCGSVMREDKFTNIVLGNGARLFCINAVEKLITECSVKSIVPGLCEFVILFCQSLLRQLGN